MNSTQKAFQNFVRDTLREARLRQAIGDRGMARLLRAGVSDAIAEYRAAHPAPGSVDPELMRRRAIARAWAETMSVGLGQPPRPRS